MNISVDDAYIVGTSTKLGKKAKGEADEEPEQGKVFIVVTVTVEGDEA